MIVLCLQDANWEALDVRDDLHSSQIQMYKPENVAIVDGQAVFTFEVNTSYDYDHAVCLPMALCLRRGTGLGA